jgi:glucose/arabinose dehydrogenase
MKRIACPVALSTISTGLLLIAQTREAARLPACDPENGGITLPAGFCAVVAADNIGIGRQMAVAANGDLFVATRNSEKSPGAIVALRDANGDGKFEVRETFAPEGGTGLALRPGYVYLGQDTRVVRYPRKEAS